MNRKNIGECAEERGEPILSIVVPCYNEKENIPLILGRFAEVLGKRQIHAILVDNGSTDGSDQLLAALMPQYPFAETVRVPVNRGYGFGIVTGLRVSNSPFIGWTHADMQTDPSDIIRAWDILEAMTQEEREVTYLKGRRRKRPLSDSFFTFGMSVFETLYLRCPLWDINAQPNIFPRSFFESLNYFPDDFSLDLYIYRMARRNGLKVRRFDVNFAERIHGTSKWNDRTWQAKKKFIVRTIDFSRRLKREAFDSAVASPNLDGGSGE